MATQPTMPTLEPWHIELARSPFFSGNAYIELPTLQAYSKVAIQIELVPFDTDGVILFNAQTESAEGDYIALILRHSFLEYRFNLGSGTVTIKSSKTVTLGESLSVEMRRHLSEGFLFFVLLVVELFLLLH